MQTLGEQFVYGLGWVVIIACLFRVLVPLALGWLCEVAKQSDPYWKEFLRGLKGQ